MPKMTRILTLNNEIESQLIEGILKERKIPYDLKKFYDSALDGIFQIQKGWGVIESYEEYREEILQIYDELIKGRKRIKIIPEQISKESLNILKLLSIIILIVVILVPVGILLVKKVIKESRNHAQICWKNGKEQYDQKNYEEAIKYFTQAINIYKNSVYLDWRGLCYFKIKKYDEALTDYNKAIKLSPYNYLYYQNIGNLYFEKKEFENAINFYSKSIHLNDKAKFLFYSRGLCYFVIKKYDEALTDIDKAIELDSSNHLLYYYRGLCNLKTKKYDEALVDFNKAIELNPDQYFYYYERGSLYKFQKNYNDALKDFDKVLKLNEKYSKFVYLELGELYYFMKNLDKSYEYFNKAKKIDPYVFLSNYLLLIPSYKISKQKFEDQKKDLLTKKDKFKEKPETEDKDYMRSDIIDNLENKLSENDFIKKYENDADQLPYVYFYLGYNYLFNNNREKAQYYFRKYIQVNNYELYKYQLSEFELK